MCRPVRSAVLLGVLLTVGCTGKPSESGGGEAIRHLADLHCQARSFQQDRYALADSIRILEDSLNRFADPGLDPDRQRRLEVFRAKVPGIWTATRDLADSIEALVRALYDDPGVDEEQRRKIDQQLGEWETRLCPDHPSGPRQD